MRANCRSSANVPSVIPDAEAGGRESRTAPGNAHDLGTAPRRCPTRAAHRRWPRRISGTARAPWRARRARPALANRLRGILRDRVEAAWLALGGPACVENETDLEDAEIYLDYLEESEEAGEIADLRAFEQGLARLYALPDLRPPKTAVQIMTIHKAKGLEFDTVIVPGLGRVPRKRDPEPLPVDGTPGDRAMRRHSARTREWRSLLLAPIKETGADGDPIYDYLVRLAAEKESHEDGRLLYVAATRAKQHLHLLGDTRLASTGERRRRER